MAEEIQHVANAIETVSRRKLLQGAAITLAGGAAAVVLPAATAISANAAPAVTTGSKKILIASSTKNVVETDSGKVYGYSRDGVIGYRGIPYAASTEKDGRFMPPGKVTPWTGTRSALYWGWASPQANNATAEGRRPGWGHDDEAFMFEWDDGKPSEDCLRINVWTPAADNKKRAVMFWIHGGGMVAGSDNELRAYDGENLARQQDVVVVSINHRLGVLGFLNLMEYGDQYATSPNVSMLDIIAALGWVKTNISNFGGDPGRVMIFGQSGGGSKVGTLMGMPAAKGLYHRASIQSGSGLRQSSVESSASLAHATLAELGVSKANLQKLHTDFTFDQIVLAGLIAQKKVAAASGARPGMMALNWGPVVDGNLIPRNTWDPAAPDFSADVPLMVGTVLNEQANGVQMGEPNVDAIDMTEAKRRIAIQNGSHADHLIEVFQKLHPTATPFELYSRITAMRGRLNAYTQAELKSKQGGAPAYLYWFQWQSLVCDGRARSFHTSELPFCFQNAELCANLTGNTPESHELAARVAGTWAAFAKTGNPNNPGIPKWNAYNEKVPTMILDTKCVAADDPDGEGRKAVLEARG
jgi:para-nitrobenzyl esterase